eukprot:2636620-Amphidinium_carterae.1
MLHAWDHLLQRRADTVDASRRVTIEGFMRDFLSCMRAAARVGQLAQSLEGLHDTLENELKRLN